MKYIIILSFLISFSKLFGADFTIDTLKVESTILSETRTILIFKPNGLNEADPLTILYMLDGEYAESRFKRIANENNKQVLGVGIINTDRRRDLLPVNQADNFLDFIEKELIPSIEPNYKTSERILFGHSFGGAFTIFSMINKPALFDKYIASSPTPIMNMVDAEIYQELEKKLQKNIRFYFSYGSKDMRKVKKWALRLQNNFVDLTTEKINWESEVFEGENHNTSDNKAIVKGIKHKRSE